MNDIPVNTVIHIESELYRKEVAKRALERGASHIIFVDAGQDGATEAHIYGERKPDWVTLCVYAAAVAAAIGAAICILMP